MPIPPLPLMIPPHLLLLPGPAAISAAHGLRIAAASRAAGAGASSLLASALAHGLWKTAPEWVREDDSWRAFTAAAAAAAGDGDATNNVNNHNDDGFVDEMASLTAVIQKLEALVVTGYDKLGSRRRMGRRRRVVRETVVSSGRNDNSEEGLLRPRKSTSSKNSLTTTSMKITEGEEHNNATTEISTLEWHAALLAYWQLCNQIRERHPRWRDRMYDIKIIERRDQIRQSAEEPSQSRQNNDGEKMMDAVKGEAIDAAVAGETPPFGVHEVVDTHHLSTAQVNAMGANNDDSDNVNSDNSTTANPQKETPDNETMDNPLETNRNKLNNSTTSMTTKNRDGPIIAPSEMKELQLMFDYAVWAYEPDETTLRSLLLTGKEPAAKGKGSSKTTKENESNDYDTASNDHGYRLIVHRTTSYIDPTQRVLLLPNEEDNNPTSKTESAKKKKNLRKPPGRVGYFVAVSRAKRTLLIGMKGTSTLEELLTDCCGRAVRVDLENDPHNTTEDDGGADNNDCDVVENDDDDFVQDDGSGCVEAKIEDVDRPEDENTTTRSSILIRHDEWDEKWDDAQDDNLLNSKMISSSADGLEKNDSGDGMMDMVHVSTSNRACPSESVEVELIHGDSQLLGFSNSASSVKSTSWEGSSCKSRSSKTKMIRKIPSDNVLLLSSTVAQQQQPCPTEQPGIVHSLTEDFMESHCIEMESNRSHKLRGAHEGILHCTHQLLFEIAPLIEEYAISKGYDVVCTGHSLGAGTAVLLAVLIRGRYPELTVPRNEEDCCDHPSFIDVNEDEASHGDVNNRKQQRVRAYAFAPPPVLDRASALACQPYVTSIVNNSDIIPRSSLTNLDVFLTVLEAVRTRLVEMGMNPAGSNINSSSTQDKNESTGGGSTTITKLKGKSAIASTIALFRKLSEGAAGDLLLTPLELQRVWEEAIAEASLGDGEEDKFYWDEEFGHHLFVPGKLLLMHETWSPSSCSSSSKEACCKDTVLFQCDVPTTDGGNSNDSQAEGCKSNKNSQISKSDDNNPSSTEFHAMWTDGTNSVLKGFEIGAGSGMVTDHLTTSYQRMLTLLERQSSRL